MEPDSYGLVLNANPYPGSLDCIDQPIGSASRVSSGNTDTTRKDVKITEAVDFTVSQQPRVEPDKQARVTPLWSVRLQQGWFDA